MNTQEHRQDFLDSYDDFKVGEINRTSAETVTIQSVNSQNVMNKEQNKRGK